MFRIKKLLCLLLAVMMICSLLPAAAFADGAGGCTKADDCAAETHEEGCPKFVPAESSCTKGEDCPAETHEEGCPKFVPAESSCTKAEDCAAETHEEGCPKFVPAKSSCTKAEDCTAETHEEGCPKFVPAKSSCTKAEDCAAETHEEGCLSLKKGEPEPEVPASVQAFLDAVALIPADITADNAEEVGELLYGEVADAYEALLGTAYEEREDVQEAVAVYKAAIAALDTVLDVDKSTYYTPPLDGYTAHDIFYNNDQPECYLYLGIHPNKPKGTHTNPSEALSVKIGETGGTQRLYTYSVSCGYCGAILHEETAEWITVEPNNTNYFSNSNPEVIENITWGLAGYVPESTSESGYAGFPALAIGFSGVKPGTTTMKFMTWQEYNYQLRAGICLSCWNYNSGANVNGWLQNKETLNISVNADYSLSYNANTSDPVTDMPTPNPDTYTGPVTSHEFTVSTAVPKRDGYTFKGWAETVNATEATYTSENSVTLNWSEGFGSTENPVSKTLYAVWEENTPPSSEPTAPSNKDVEDLLNANAVKVECVNSDATHAVKEVTYNLIPSSYQINSVTGDAENGYQCTLTVYPAMYLLAFGADDGVLCGHTLDPDTQESATITLEYVDKVWKVVAGSAPVTFTVTCEEESEPTTPDVPTDDALKNLFGQTIMVRCNNSEATHADKTYGLEAGYTIGEVSGDAASGYRCTITVSADPYVEKYNKDVASGHKLADGQPTSQDITLSYDLTNSKWKLPNLDGPITFNVKCGDEPASTYTYSLSYNANTSDEVTGMPASNPDTYTGPETSHTFTVSSANPQRNGYTFKGWAETAAATTANAQDSYTLTSEKPTMTLYAVWEQNTTQPTPPPELGKPDDTTVKRLLPQAVKIDCVNGSAEHADQTYGLLEGSYSIGEPYPSGSRSSAFYCCDITIFAAKYVEEYNKTNAGHSLATGEDTSKTITLKYDEDAATWTVPANAAPVVFRVVCSTSQPATDWSKLTITKTVSPTGTVMPGDTVTYTITVTNNTGKLLHSITVSEALDSRLELLGYTATGSYDAANGIWSFPVGTAVFANGSSATLTITAKVKANATGTINNTATITGAVSGEEELTLDPRPSSSVSITVGTPAPMNTFTLRYNANGGSGAPSSQSVETTADSVVMTVSSVQPTRHGYHFCGWALTPNGHVAYRSGNEITLTGDVTLYAVWVTPTASPQTGDSSNVALWAAVAGISLAAGAVVLFVLKKRKAE